LFGCGKEAVENICEIGFNAGHSTMLMLLGRTNTPINFTIFDINHHTYTSECYDYIKTKFPQVNFEFVEGDSIVMIPEWTREYRKYETFDIIHVDGGHALDIIQNDFANSVKLLKKNGVIIIDDVQKTHINDLVNAYIYSGMFEEITSIFETTFYPHRILKKCI
jgi:predicted O-methyltransferase YrrM